MEQPHGHPCPECGAPRQRDNTPSCACTDRAAEALREARTAQAAAAEDFDPLRIRPYVEIDPGTAPGHTGTPTDPTATPEGTRGTTGAEGARGVEGPGSAEASAAAGASARPAEGARPADGARPAEGGHTGRPGATIAGAASAAP
ncbi:peptidoglycan-binding protein, partial [Streptomyces sp. DT73]